MTLHLVLLHFVLAFSLASTNQCVLSPGSSIDLSLHSLKNASGHWIITIDTRRFTMKENPRELTVNVHQETRSCESSEIEQLISVAFVYPSLQGTSMPGAMEPNAASSTTTTTTPSTTITAAPSTRITATPSTRITATPSTTTTAALFTTNSTAPSTRITAAPSTTTNATTTTTSTTRQKSCPHSGYQLFADFNCYKAFPYDLRTWSDAREKCRKDGGDLMSIETERERKEVFIPLFDSVTYYKRPWVGVYLPQGGDDWMTVKGEPALSTLWVPRNPDNDPAHKCTDANYEGLLRNNDCANRWPFICEIPL